MKEIVTYLNEEIDYTDPMWVNHFANIGAGKLAQAVLGDKPLVRGLDCTPTAPASLQVQIAAGEIYSLENVGKLPSGEVDTDHTVVKQGFLEDPILLDCPAPATEGHSVVHLIQAHFEEVDDEKDLLGYRNASNPQQMWWGKDNDGKTQPTVRESLCRVVLKAGVSAPTGREQRPAVDVGYVGAVCGNCEARAERHQ